MSKKVYLEYTPPLIEALDIDIESPICVISSDSFIGNGDDFDPDSD